jgi:LmbE family N-acetylglucosaminyl deacetylase
MKIVAIGAHPDDIELGCGGLLLKAVRNGHNVYMYTLTRGSASGDPQERTKELIQSSKIIGADGLWIDNFEDTHLSNSHDLISHIEFIIRKTRADLVITHSLNDTHHDHRAIAASTIEAGRNVPNIMAYEIPLTKDFKPQIFYDISDVIDEKVELLNLFKSQMDKLYLKANAIKGLAEYRALQSRLNRKSNQSDASAYPDAFDYVEAFDHVEAFEVLKICVDKGFKLWNSSPEEIDHSEYAIPNYVEMLEIVR